MVQTVESSSLKSVLSYSGEIVDSLTEQTIECDGNVAIVGNAGTGKTTLATKFIVDALSEEVQVIILDRIDPYLHLEYESLSRTLLKIGVNLESFDDVTQASQSSADCIVVGVDGSEGSQFPVKEWESLLDKICRSHLKTLLVISKASDLARSSGFQTWLQWVMYCGPTVGIQVILDGSSLRWFVKSTDLHQNFPTILIGGCRYSNDFTELGLPNDRLEKYRRDCTICRWTLSVSFLLVNNAGCADVQYYPSLITLSIAQNSWNFERQRKEFFKYFSDPVEALTQFAHVNAVAMQYSLVIKELSPDGLEVLPPLRDRRHALNSHLVEVLLYLKDRLDEESLYFIKHLEIKTCDADWERFFWSIQDEGVFNEYFSDALRDEMDFRRFHFRISELMYEVQRSKSMSPFKRWRIRHRFLCRPSAFERWYVEQLGVVSIKEDLWCKL